MGITLLYGTGNPAKLASMREYLSGTGVTLLGLKDMPSEPPEVCESGNSPLDNARIKALAYFRHYGIPTFSCDSGLYIRQLPDGLQPGVCVRNIGGKRLTDDEMTEYYSGLAKKYGRLTARYHNAICLVLSETEIYEQMGGKISGNSFYITDKPHPKKIEGYPLDRISLDIRTGKYFYDMTPEDFLLEESSGSGFREFFTYALNIKEKPK